MLDGELIPLVFAPATVGLVVTALRRTPAAVYWASLLAIVTLTLVGLSQQHSVASRIEIGPMLFGVMIFVVPTIAAFSVGRLIVPSRGGAYVFAATCSAYLLGLGLAAALGGLFRMTAL